MMQVDAAPGASTCDSSLPDTMMHVQTLADKGNVPESAASTFLDETNVHMPGMGDIPMGDISPQGSAPASLFCSTVEFPCATCEYNDTHLYACQWCGSDPLRIPTWNRKKRKMVRFGKSTHCDSSYQFIHAVFHSLLLSSQR